MKNNRPDPLEIAKNLAFAVWRLKHRHSLRTFIRLHARDTVEPIERNIQYRWFEELSDFDIPPPSSPLQRKTTICDLKDLVPKEFLQPIKSTTGESK